MGDKDIPPINGLRRFLLREPGVHPYLVQVTGCLFPTGHVAVALNYFVQSVQVFSSMADVISFFRDRGLALQWLDEWEDAEEKEPAS